MSEKEETGLKLPLRWQDDYAYAFIFDAEDNVVVFLGETDTGEQSMDWHKVAAEIVRAVNSHDQLLEALKVARVHVWASCEAEHMMDGFGPRSHQPSDDVLAMVDAAIALAAPHGRETK